jgi:putative Mn2+ efflux pump MntP
LRQASFSTESAKSRRLQYAFVAKLGLYHFMHPISIFLLGIAMSTDAFAAAVAKGAAMRNPRFSEALRAGVIFGTIEGLTPVIGWLLGLAAAQYITAWDHWIAFTLLGLLGLHMIYAGLKPESEGDATDATRRMHGFWSLAATGFATSIDAMVVGVGLAFLDVNIGVVALVIGLTTLVMVTLGIMLGRLLGSLAGKRAEIAGGFMLIAIGAAILHEHLSA